MALTAAQLKSAKRWLGKKMFQEAGLTANQDADDLAAAVTATDVWVDANVAAWLATVPEPFKSATDGDQKALLFAAVALARRGLV